MFDVVDDGFDDTDTGFDDTGDVDVSRCDVVVGCATVSTTGRG